MHVEWDFDKALSNGLKHGVFFDEAETALHDSLARTVPDRDHSCGEQRYLPYGMSSSERLLVVAHADRGDVVRLISARLATRAERKLYETR